MLFCLHGAIEKLAAWGEMCPCHGWLGDLTTEQRARFDALLQHLGKDIFDGVCKCSLRGRRAAELAVGEAITFFQGICNSSSTLSKLLEAFSVLPVADAQMITDDFWRGATHITSVLQMKLAYWQQLPWKLAGLAHACLVTARRIAREIVEYFNSAPSNEELHGKITWLFADPAGVLRHCLERFANGEELDSMPELATKVASMRMMPVVERDIERRHSEMHKTIAGRSSGGPIVSLSVRLQEYDARLETQGGDELFRTTCKDFAAVRKARDLPFVLNFEHHPTIAGLLGEKKPRATYSKILSSVGNVLYTIDLASKHVRYYEAKSRNKIAKDRVKKAATGWLKNVKQGSNRCGDGRDQCFQNALLDHFRATASPNGIYSIPIDTSAMDLAMPLSQALLELPDAKAAAPLDTSIDLDVDDGAEVDGNDFRHSSICTMEPGGVEVEAADVDAIGRGSIFFKLIKANPSRAKLMTVAHPTWF